ncbi:DUF2585 family protein [Candidatus Parcubacteria bacterium]|nr:MAG: DUF2585 family protein [Candidatus Parcubacteria bacterium]
MQRIPLFIAIIVLFLGIQAATLYALGQPALCECGIVQFWEGDVGSNGNSQQFADWYTFSHIIHGFLFYLALWYLFPKLNFLQRLTIAVALEVGWELFENTPLVIEHYRQQALAAGYVGDSILNSISDTVAMMIGFVFAARMPVWATIFAAIGLELYVGYSIRDNLTLNIMGFFYNPEFLSNWQLRK